MGYHERRRFEYMEGIRNGIEDEESPGLITFDSIKIIWDKLKEGVDVSYLKEDIKKYVDLKTESPELRLAKNILARL